MGKLVFSLFLVSILAFYVQCSCPGCPSDISEDDLKSEELKNFAKQGVHKIYEKKLAENKLGDCIKLEGDIQSGTSQVVAGILHKLTVSVKPVQSKEGNCAAADVDLSGVPTETCVIEIWSKPLTNPPADEPTEITFKCP